MIGERVDIGRGGWMAEEEEKEEEKGGGREKQGRIHGCPRPLACGWEW